MSEHSAHGLQPDDESRAALPEDTVAPLASEKKTSKCPACLVGNLFVIASDPDATHEAGNDAAAQHEHYKPSGGSQTVKCFYCGIQSTQALGNEGGS